MINSTIADVSIREELSDSTIQRIIDNHIQDKVDCVLSVAVHSQN